MTTLACLLPYTMTSQDQSAQTVQSDLRLSMSDIVRVTLTKTFVDYEIHSFSPQKCFPLRNIIIVRVLGIWGNRFTLKETRMITYTKKRDENLTKDFLPAIETLYKDIFRVPIYDRF